MADRFPNVHLALCPHDGPTSKADCLNWIFQHLLSAMKSTGERFDVIVTHDAEDLIHPDELRWINYYAARYDFIQTPVLALATPLLAIDARRLLRRIRRISHARHGGAAAAGRISCPSAGVGTGYRRDALDRLAEAASNRRVRAGGADRRL